MKFRPFTIIHMALVLIVPFTENALGARRSSHVTSVTAKAIELSKAFEAKGLKLGAPVFIRVYKQTSEMELWVEKGARFVLFKTYGICRWSGGLGPKYYEGDRQSPEGLYRITPADLIVNARWDRAMNINYPNSFDVINGRSGSGILIHGKCGSIGCFAIQDRNVEEVYGAVRAALEGGQAYIPVLSLPFRFADLAPSREDTRQMSEFWADLRRADLLFERDRLPPAAWICDGRYYFADRRGDSHRHTVHLPGCTPLRKPAHGRVASNLPEKIEAANAAPVEAIQKLAESEVKGCDPKRPGCRLLHAALKSPVICPAKYARCRTAKARFTKSVDCPLKYPRCRRSSVRLSGRMHTASRLASRKGRAIRVKRGHRTAA
jgi:murein L,D-transpeptidase YafK